MSRSTGRGESAGRSRRAESPADRLTRLERELREARAAIKEDEQRRLAVIGAAVMDEAEGDAELKARVIAICRKRVTGRRPRADIADLLIEPTGEATHGGPRSGALQ